MSLARRLRREIRSNAWNVIMVVAVIALFIYPVVLLVLGSFRTTPPGTPGDWSPAPFVDAFTRPTTYAAFGNSIFYAVSKEIIVLILAIVLVLVATRTRHPAARFITPIAIMVFAMPTLFFALSWDMLGNAKIGLLNQWFSAIPIVGDWIPNIDVETWPGIIGVTALKSTAIEYLLLLGPFSAMDRSLEEAAVVSGASRMKTVLTVNLPVMLPTISAVAIIGIGNVMGTLEVPLVLGLPANIQVFSSKIYNFINAEYPADYGQASSLSIVLIALVLALVLVQRIVLRGRSYQTVTGKTIRREPWRVSGFSSFLIYVIVIGYGVLALVLPLFELILSSFQPFFGSMTNLSLRNYEQLFKDAGVFEAIGNSLIVAVGGGFVAMALAVAFSYGRSRRTRIGGFISVATWVPYALPGIVLSLATLWAFVPIPGLQLLYGTIWIVTIALVINTVPLTSRVAENALEQISVSLEEAALVAGASRIRVIVGILVRLILPSFLIGWFVAIIMMIGNLDVPILMSGTENQTIAVKVFQFYAGGLRTRAAALFCILLLMIVVFFVIVLVLRRFLARGTDGQRLSALDAIGISSQPAPNDRPPTDGRPEAPVMSQSRSPHS